MIDGGRFPDLDPDITILAGTDVDDVWDRFEVFEALHHSTQICNPMSSDELDEVITAMGVSDGAHIVDFACGYGELLFRASSTASVSGTGVDLSPWMLNAACTSAAVRAPEVDLAWVLGDARDFHSPIRPDVAVCLGAEWIWHDFGGTARALSRRLHSGGVAVIGAGRLHHDADQDEVSRTRGRVETIDDMHELLTEHGLDPIHRVDPDDAGWDAYIARTAKAVAEWSRQHPGPRADKWVEEQADWQVARDRDRDVIGWSVWIARKRASTPFELGC